MTLEELEDTEVWGNNIVGFLLLLEQKRLVRW